MDDEVVRVEMPNQVVRSNVMDEVEKVFKREITLWGN